jgi:AcrR family transcriptional regulator
MVVKLGQDKPAATSYIWVMTRAAPYNRDVALDAALSLFWQKGYHATSLKDLEGALQMKPGSIYAAFKSKEALYLAALDRYFDRNLSVLAHLQDNAASPLIALADFLRGFAGQAVDDPNRQACMLVRTMLDMSQEEGVIGARARDHLDVMLDKITQIFATAQQAGELPANADLPRLARRFQAEVTALRIEAHRGGNPANLVDLAEDMAQDVEALRV